MAEVRKAGRLPREVLLKGHSSALIPKSGLGVHGKERLYSFGQSIEQILSSAVAYQVCEDIEARDPIAQGLQDPKATSRLPRPRRASESVSAIIFIAGSAAGKTARRRLLIRGDLYRCFPRLDAFRHPGGSIDARHAAERCEVEVYGPVSW